MARSGGVTLLALYLAPSPRTQKAVIFSCIAALNPQMSHVHPPPPSPLPAGVPPPTKTATSPCVFFGDPPPPPPPAAGAPPPFSLSFTHFFPSCPAPKAFSSCHSSVPPHAPLHNAPVIHTGLKVSLLFRFARLQTNLIISHPAYCRRSHHCRVPDFSSFRNGQNSISTRANLRPPFWRALRTWLPPLPNMLSVQVPLSCLRRSWR